MFTISPFGYSQSSKKISTKSSSSSSITTISSSSKTNQLPVNNDDTNPIGNHTSNFNPSFYPFIPPNFASTNNQNIFNDLNESLMNMHLKNKERPIYNDNSNYFNAAPFTNKQWQDPFMNSTKIEFQENKYETSSSEYYSSYSSSPYMSLSSISPVSPLSPRPIRKSNYFIQSPNLSIKIFKFQFFYLNQKYLKLILIFS